MSAVLVLGLNETLPSNDRPFTVGVTVDLKDITKTKLTKPVSMMLSNL